MPSNAVAFHDDAAAEYDVAFDWYLERSPDSALKFDAEVSRALAEIARHLCVGLLDRTAPEDFCSANFLSRWSIENGCRGSFRSWRWHILVAGRGIGSSGYSPASHLAVSYVQNPNKRCTFG